MHDPLVVAWEIPAPIPRREKYRDARPGQPRWTLGRRRRTNPENLGEPIYGWYRPHGWEPKIAGRAFGLYRLATIWHVEPGGHDSGEVCKHWVDGKRTNAWRWHVRHWKIQVIPYQRVHRWICSRCGECGRRFFWKDSRHGYMSSDTVYHDKCMTLRHVQGQLDDATKVLTFTASDTERWRVESRLKHLEEKAPSDV
jgi:hypothetical protein